jgi:60 kDa SS-A/Ro ribonucleoprotein
LTNALQDAADHSLDNIPAFQGKTYVMVDTSGSMQSPATGNRGSVTSKTSCIDVAAVFAAAILRKNPDAEIVPFSTGVHVHHKFNPRDSVMTNAWTLAALGGGGTNCSAALAYVNGKAGKGDLVIYVSDNMSWLDKTRADCTQTMIEWNKFKARNKDAKLVCIDIQPYANTQAHDRDDVLNVGGFNDQCFDVIARFLELGHNKDLWIKTIEEVTL